MRTYDSDAFGTKQTIPMDVSSALNGTVGATEINRMTFMHAARVTDWNIRAKVGGTEGSVRQILIGKSLAGTGAFSAIGTQALGTLADGNIVDASLTETDFSAGDDLVIQHLGTGAGVYVIQPLIQYREAFVEA
jgi:hypothetical protein